MADDQGSANILHLTAQIVSAHVAHNTVSVDALPKLVQDVHDALKRVEAGLVPAAAAAPAVPVKQSLFRDHLVCLNCARNFSSLKRHLRTEHSLTPEQYRQTWGLAATYPMVAPNYAKQRSAMAKQFGLGRVSNDKPAKARGRKRGK